VSTDPEDRIPVDLLVAGGLVVTFDPRPRVIEDGAVAIAGDRIAAVGPRVSVERQFRAAQQMCPRLVARSGLPLQRRWPVER
jgi:5-methylthioadenosine/S-adenosylhomocysteine deaminase